MAGDWTKREDITGARAKKAIAWGDKMADIINGKTDETWDALLPFIDEKRFVRRGNERDEPRDWPAYRLLLEAWADSSNDYSKTLHRVSEAGNVVYLDFDERSVSRAGQVGTLRSISIYEFDDADRIIAVDVCMGFHVPG